MSSFTVHTIPGSPFARAVMATLEEKGRPWRLHPLGPGMHRTSPHIERHPFGRMPTLDHDGFVLYETQAILRYLDRVLPEPSLTPADPKDAARMDQVMNVNDWYLFQGCASVIGFHRVVAPRVLGLQPDEEAILAAMPRARLVMGELSRLLGPHEYFAGEAISLADLLVAPHIDLLALAPEWGELAGIAPNVEQWRLRMEARPSMQATTWPRVAALAASEAA